MRWTKVVALAAVGSFSLAACGGGGSDKKSASASATDDLATVPASAALVPNEQGPAAAIPEAKSGGTITFNAETAPGNFDPSTQYFNDTNTILKLTTRALTQYKMKDGKSVLVPDMATDLGKSSADGLTWSFTLKPGLKYEDGTEVKASDIKYSVERSFDTKTWKNGPRYQIEKFKGGDTFRGPYENPKGLDSIKADDAKRTISFELRKKFVTFPYFASFTMFGGIPKAKDTKSNYQLKWVSTGPYKVAKYTAGSALTLVKNTQWDPKTDPSRHQYPDGFQFNFNRDQATSAKAIMADNGVDQTTASYDGVDPSILTQVMGEKKDRVVVGASPCTRWPGATMDTQKIPLEVRKAIATAWPIDQVRLAGGLNQYSVTPGPTISAPQVPGFTKYELPGLTGKGQGDTAKAKQMLTAAGKSGFQLSYYYANDNEGSKKIQAVLQPALEKAGFTVKAIGQPTTQYRDKIQKPAADVNMGTGVATGWCYDWPSGDAIYPPIFGSTLEPHNGVGNVKNAELDRLMNEAAALPIEQQGPKWTAIDKKVLSEILPVVPMFYDKAAVIHGSKVKGIVIDPNAGMPVMANMWVAQ